MPDPLRRSLHRRDPLAPLAWLVLPLPLWWVLGLATVGYFIVAVPMLVALLRLRPLRFPPGYGWWLGFLLWLCLSIVMLPLSAPGTIDQSLQQRAIPAAFRFAEYAAATITLLWAFNLDRRRVPTERLVRLLAVLLLWTVAGGILGTLAPGFELRSAAEVLLPHSVTATPYVAAMIHPSAAQLQDLTGDGSAVGRAMAPYPYSNSWGNALGLLLPIGVAAAATARTSRRRWGWGLLVVVALVPALLSLNRGLWLALAIAGAAVWIQLLVTRRFGAAISATIVALLAVVALALSPLGGAAAARTTGNQPSNDIRSFSVRRALEVAEQSPILGYGGTRAQQGSNSTIAVGKSPTCPNCGNLPIGTNGQLWFSLVGQGFVGAFAYLMFHVAALVRLLRGRSVVPVAAGVSMLLAIWFEFVYDRVVSTSCIEFLVLAVGLRAMLPDRAGRPVATATTAVPR